MKHDATIPERRRYYAGMLRRYTGEAELYYWLRVVFAELEALEARHYAR